MTVNNCKFNKKLSSRRSRAMLYVVENFSVTRSHWRSFEFTPLGRECV